jgi:hypothetical protein
VPARPGAASRRLLNAANGFLKNWHRFLCLGRPEDQEGRGRAYTSGADVISERTNCGIGSGARAEWSDPLSTSAVSLLRCDAAQANRAE